MDGNAERRAAPSLGKRVGVDDGPGNMRAGAVAGAGEQSADLFEGEAERSGSGENVGGSAKRQMIAAQRRRRQQRAR